MRDWGATAGGCMYVFHAAYVPWLAFACVVALGGLIGLRVAYVQWRRAHPRSGPPGGRLQPGAIAGAGLGLLAVGLALVGTGCAQAKLDDAFRTDVLFWSLCLTCGIASAVALAMLVASVVMVASYHAMGVVRLLPGIAAIVASLGAVTLAVVQVEALGRAYLPVIEVPGAVGFHAGMARHARPALFHQTEAGQRIPFEDPAWTVDDVVFEAAAPGTVERTAFARQGPFTVSTPVKAKAHGDEGSPYLSLHVGNAWHYALTTTSQVDGTQYLLVFTGKSETSVKTAGVVVSIEPAPARDGWREYTLLVKSEEGDALGQHVVRPLDGETYFYDRTPGSAVEPPDEPVAADPKCPLKLLLDVDPGSEPERGCRMANLGAGRCQLGGAPEDVLPPLPADVPAKGAPKKPPARASKAPPPIAARVPTQYALAGPSHLSTHWENHGGASSWIVGLLTAGIVIPTGMSGGNEYVLMRTVRGGVPPAPR